MEEMSFEEGMARIDEITTQLEEKELSLDEQFRLYKEGIELVRACSNKLDTVEKEMQIISGAGEQP